MPALALSTLSTNMFEEAYRSDTASNVADYLIEGKAANQFALLSVGAAYTYGDLLTAADGAARCCLQQGCHKGDRVLLVGENSLFWVAAYLGILRTGSVCVPLAASVSAQDLQYVLQTTGARIAFAQARFALKNVVQFRGLHVITDRELPDLPGVASQRAFSAAEARSSNARISHVPTRPDDLAALMFTSGSTARPRGVMVSHRNIIANTESIIQSLGLTEKDRIMTVLPFHYCFGTSLLHTHLKVGGSLVIDSHFMYPETVLQRMIDTDCTGFAGVPSHFQILLRSSSLRSKIFPHLRSVQQAGGHLAPAFVRQLGEALPGTQLFIMYGQTEATARLSCLAPCFLQTKLGSIGRGIPGVKLRVLNEEGVAVRPGEVGEIVAEGDNVTQGYWGDCAASAIAFRQGKLYTGDLAKVDEDGFIYIVDRARDFLKCGGTRVSCRQIEDQLLEFDALLEAAVIAMPDDVLGEAVKAFVVPREAECCRLEERLLNFCRERMAPHVIPKEIVVLKALPKNSGGKTLRAKLKSM